MGLPGLISTYRFPRRETNDRLETPTLQLIPSCKHNRHVLTTLDTNLCHYVKMSCFFRFLSPPSRISSFKNTGPPQKKSQAPPPSKTPHSFVPVKKCPQFPPSRFSLESSERTLAARSCTSKTPQALPICNSITYGGSQDPQVCRPRIFRWFVGCPF